jgi:arylsulfatase A-like enzyme
MDRPPNVILIHCHDLGKFLPCYGSTAIRAPRLDALAAAGVVFDNAFSTAPLCTPARSSLFTGLSPHANGLMGLVHDGWRYRRSVATLPELLGAAGYATALVGLQHEHPDPAVLGFGEVHGMGFLPRALPVAEEAAGWLRRHGGRPEPFFLTVGTWEVHRPWRPEDYPPADAATVQVPPFLPDTVHTRADLAGFYGAVEQLDLAVGHVLTAAEQSCDPAHTMVVFTTDHGAAFPRAKGTLYDPGVGVPLIVRPPTTMDIPAGRRAHLVSHLDLVPTLLELAGVPPPANLEGRSLLPALRGDPPADRALFLEKTFHDGYDPIRAVRTTRYKYIRNFTAGPALRLSKDLEESPTRRGMGDSHLAPRPPVELYDLHEDPWERRNLAEASDHTVSMLDEKLTDWMAGTHDPLLHGTIARPPPRSRLVDAQPDLPAGEPAPPAQQR